MSQVENGKIIGQSDIEKFKRRQMEMIRRYVEQKKLPELAKVRLMEELLGSQNTVGERTQRDAFDYLWSKPSLLDSVPFVDPATIEVPANSPDFPESFQRPKSVTLSKPLVRDLGSGGSIRDTFYRVRGVKY